MKHNAVGLGVKEYLGSYTALADDKNIEFKQHGPKTPEDLLLFYKFCQGYLLENSTHDVPTVIRKWKGKVLDFGGGAGNVSFFMASGGCNVDYMDINLMQQDFIRWFSKKSGVKVHVVEAPRDMYDFIIMRDVIEHLFDYETVMTGLFQWLRLEGRVYAKPEFKRLPVDGMSVHFNDKGNFDDFMKRSGFVEEEQYVWRKVE